MKQPEVAAGMAAYSGVKVAQSLPGIGTLMAGDGYNVDNSMYLQGYDTPGLSENVYASNYTLAGYDVPGM